MDGMDGAKLVIIQTDGEENCSTQFKKANILEMVKTRTLDGWQFVYLGCEIDAMQEAAAIGISAGSTMSYAGGQSVGTFSTLAQRTSHYAARGSRASSAFFAPQPPTQPDLPAQPKPPRNPKRKPSVP
jgi:hypothetical protein